MNARGTTLERPAVERSDALDVVAAGVDVPDWAVQWCQRSGRVVRTLPPPETAAESIRVVGELSGRTVLVLRADVDAARPSRIVAAVRHLGDDALVLAEAAASAVTIGASLELVHAVPLSFAERSVGLDDAVDHGRWVLRTAVEYLAVHAPGLDVVPHLLRVRPHELVGEALDADLLVVGGAREPGLLGLVAGSALQHAPCPVLFAPRLR